MPQAFATQIVHLANAIQKDILISVPILDPDHADGPIDSAEHVSCTHSQSVNCVKFITQLVTWQHMLPVLYTRKQ